MPASSMPARSAPCVPRRATAIRPVGCVQRPRIRMPASDFVAALAAVQQGEMRRRHGTRALNGSRPPCAMSHILRRGCGAM
ncbi:hypothetical protein DD607_30270 [Salmonella sp. 3DZ2-4SM]|nr:hypothetical protein DD607_30270 [Salmonella sp. 3DZ2-4SM]